jgi:hypothetical protein
VPQGDVLRRHRDAILDDWLERTAGTYPEHMARFLLAEKDPFKNPGGNAIRESLPKLLDGLLAEAGESDLKAGLLPVVRMRAVQSFTASQAVSFVFMLKDAVRKALGGVRDEAAREEAAALEGRIDALALIAFDVFMGCREKMYEIQANEAKRRVYQIERAVRGDGGEDAPLPGAAGDDPGGDAGRKRG